MRSGELSERIRRGAPLLRSNSPAGLYNDIVSLWRDPARVVVGGTDKTCEDVVAFKDVHGLTAAEQFMAADLVGYLPNDILVKVDRAAMAVSLETRMPFLDHRLIEFAWRLPFNFKIEGDQTKAILRRLLHRYVPKGLVDRPKMGFGAPIDEWLRGPLREWAEALLDPRLLGEQGYLDAKVIERLWRDHLSGTVDEQRRLWVILMFQSWLAAHTGRGTKARSDRKHHAHA